MPRQISRWTLNDKGKPYGSIDAARFVHSGRLGGCTIAFLIPALFLSLVIHIIHVYEQGTLPIAMNAVFIHDPYQLFVIIITILYTSLLFFRGIILVSAVNKEGDIKLEDNSKLIETYENVKGQENGHYLVVAALYKEPVAVVRLVNNLAALQYPREKLTILLVTEETEEHTSTTDAQDHTALRAIVLNCILISTVFIIFFAILPPQHLCLLPIVLILIGRSFLGLLVRVLLTLLPLLLVPLGFFRWLVAKFNTGVLHDRHWRNGIDMGAGYTVSSIKQKTTFEAAKEAIKNLKDDIRTCFVLVKVPKVEFAPSVGRYEPQTKPRALNYALYYKFKKSWRYDSNRKDFCEDQQFSAQPNKFEYCAVYDAEDRPEIFQLLKAVKRFEELKESGVVCLQARLTYENLNSSWLISLFKAEYAALFYYLLPGLDHHKLIIPLGGTSNHFRFDYLRNTLGGWDAYNVTEDCDVGIWIARDKKRIATLDSETWELIDGKPAKWVNQRSRWIKGYMQTYFVHMRNPISLQRQLGWCNFLFGFQPVMLAGFLLPMISPLLLLMTLFYISSVIAIYFQDINIEWIRSTLAYIFSVHDPRIIPLETAGFFLGNAIYLFILFVGHIRHPKPGRTRDILLFWWIYWWFLTSWAALKALREFITNPYYWDLSSHDYVN